MTIRAYPWTALERVPKHRVRQLAGANQAVRLAFEPEALGRELSELVGADVRVELGAFGAARLPARRAEVNLETASVRVTFAAEAELVKALLERVLGRPFALARPNPELDAQLAGAFAALVVEAARRIAREPVMLVATPLPEESIGAQMTLFVDGRPYAAHVRAAAAYLPTGLPGPAPLAALRTLGEITLSIPLVVGVSLARRADLKELVPGSIFLPGEPLWVDAGGRGHAALAGMGSERGARVDWGSNAEIVLRGDTVLLALDTASSESDMGDANDLNQTLADAALEAPLVVRVEIGAVSLSASAWAALKPGDVIETGKRVAEPVLLRIGGRAVARGELVDIEGEVGVRVRELLATPEP
jgi:flagellar motor switch/type III secretory pathway protein FliN